MRHALRRRSGFSVSTAESHSSRGSAVAKRSSAGAASLTSGDDIGYQWRAHDGGIWWGERSYGSMTGGQEKRDRCTTDEPRVMFYTGAGKEDRGRRRLVETTDTLQPSSLGAHELG